MDNNNLIINYELYDFHYSNIHSAGPDIFFYNPYIGYIKNGYAKFLYKGKVIYAHKGDLIYIAQETRYQSIWYGNPDVEWYSISFDFNSKYAFYDYRFQVLKNYPAEIFEKMYQNYKTAPLLSISYFYKLLDDIYKKLEKSPHLADYSVIKPAVEYIEKNYQKPISVKSLAALCHISESGFFKNFKSVTGITPITYKHNIMIRHSIDLLSYTSMTVEQISLYVGFPSSNYFRKVFRSVTDKTPNELRKNNIM